MSKKKSAKNKNHSEKERSLTNDEISIHQQAFAAFLEGMTNADMVRTSDNLKNCSISALLKPAVEIVVDQLEKIAQKVTPFTRDQKYSSRRQKVIDQIVSRRRWIFHGPQSNSLGESTLKNFIKLCQNYFTEGDLLHFDQSILMKIFRRWFYPGRESMIKQHLPVRGAGQEGLQEFYELRMKRRQMQDLRIEHQILKKQAEMVKIQRQIEDLQLHIKSRRSRNSASARIKVQEEEQDQEQDNPLGHQQQELSKREQERQLQIALEQSKHSIKNLQDQQSSLSKAVVKTEEPATAVKPILSNDSTDKVEPSNKHNTRKQVLRTRKQPNNESSSQKNKLKQVSSAAVPALAYTEQKNDKQQPLPKNTRQTVRPSSPYQPKQKPQTMSVQDKKWTAEEQKALIDLSVSKGNSNRVKLSTEMAKQFGENPKFESANLSDKKISMFSRTRRAFLVELEKRALINPSQFKKFSVHFQNVDKRQSQEFLSKFLQIFYFSEIGSMSNKAFVDTVNQVYKQKTRVLSESYLKKNKLLLQDKFGQDGEEEAVSKTQSKKKQTKTSKDHKQTGKGKVGANSMEEQRNQQKSAVANVQKQKMNTQEQSILKQQQSSELSKQEKQLNLKQTVKSAFLGMING